MDTYDHGERKIRVATDRILLKLDPMAQETKGGIIIPGHLKGDLYQTGVVLAKGPGSRDPDKAKRRLEDAILADIEIGSRLLVIWVQREVHTNILVRSLFADDIIVVRSMDIILALDEEDIPRLG